MFFKKKNKEPTTSVWTCYWCKKCADHPDTLFGRFQIDRYDGKYCNWCAYSIDERNRKNRKRKEDLAAMVVGRLASQMPGFRDEKFDHVMAANEAFKFAEAIMNLPGEGKDYD
jgi:hypothetical protein